MDVPTDVLQEARDYAEEKDEDVVIYEEPSVKSGYDFMTEDMYFENGHDEDDVLHTVWSQHKFS